MIGAPDFTRLGALGVHYKSKRNDLEVFAGAIIDACGGPTMWAASPNRMCPHPGGDEISKREMAWRCQGMLRPLLSMFRIIIVVGKDSFFPHESGLAERERRFLPGTYRHFVDVDFCPNKGWAPARQIIASIDYPDAAYSDGYAGVVRSLLLEQGELS